MHHAWIGEGTYFMTLPVVEATTISINHRLRTNYGGWQGRVQIEKNSAKVLSDTNIMYLQDYRTNHPNTTTQN